MRREMAVATATQTNHVLMSEARASKFHSNLTLITSVGDEKNR